MNLGPRVPGQLLSLLTLSLFLAPCYATQSKPNVIIILTDDLGACRTFGVSPLFSTTVIF